ncbi:L,D-transpeptidase family protein [Arsenicibacter rosenii]|uniref:L,D-TPase catalytic domain-containing protein n=1 Tax=Arsenicibacter rosenii TaxID=1750698 RepID=A0A1S2VQT6_9BACT|nr:L,D-transpeptidase family protein [Arsenicibacter rosenii]OIN60750.1 hypothetical protein BLX24_01210 [Arsenicibacter rosenii]
MRYCIVLFVALLLRLPAVAQSADDLNRLRHYASVIGTDSVCVSPDPLCLKLLFTEIVYGRKPRNVGFTGAPEHIDSVRINRLTASFLRGGDWCPLLDSLESKNQAYQLLKEYCMQCLTDDYMADSLTMAKIRETLNTYRWLNRFSTGQCIVVNLPSATLRVFDRSGKPVLSSRVIVGKPATPTPLFTAVVTGIVMYPYWTIPKSILIREILPAVRKNPLAQLEAMKLQVIDARGKPVDPATVNWSVPATAFPYRLRQATGCDNALGLMKFNVNDPYDIYLHDTNARNLFATANRFLSHGCIRVEKPVELANQLLGKPAFTASYMKACPANAVPRTIPLPKTIPVVMTYNLIDLDEDGSIQVYRDRYHLWQTTL